MTSSYSYNYASSPTSSSSSTSSFSSFSSSPSFSTMTSPMTSIVSSSSSSSSSFTSPPSSHTSSSSSSTISPSSSSSSSIYSRVPISMQMSDGFIYTLPKGLPLSPHDTMFLSTHHPSLLHSLDPAPTIELMRRGQKFHQVYRSLSPSDENNKNNIFDIREIFLWYDKTELTRDGANIHGPGALYWSLDQSNQQERVLTLHRCMPLQSIKEIFLGKITQNFQSPQSIIKSIDDDVCFSLMAENSLLDLHAASTHQLCAWLFGLCTLMNQCGQRVFEADEESGNIIHNEQSEMEMMMEGETEGDKEGDSNKDKSTSAAIQKRLSSIPVDIFELDDLVAEGRNHRSTHRFSILPPGDKRAKKGNNNGNGSGSGKKGKQNGRQSGVNTMNDSINTSISLSSPLSSSPSPSSLLTLTSPLTSLRTSYDTLSTTVRDDLNTYHSYLTTMNSQFLSLVRRQQKSFVRMKNEYSEEVIKRKKLQNKLIEIQGNIRVFVRIRPSSEEEKREWGTLGGVGEGMIQMINDETIVLHPPDAQIISANNPNGNNILNVNTKEKEKESKTFEFDRVFGPQSTQQDIYNEVSPFISSAIDGYNVCVFAYGQTGAGKSYTMEGPLQDRGVNYRALNELFNTVESNGRNMNIGYKVNISVVELYQDNIKDLLRENHHNNNKISSPPPPSLTIRHSPDNGIFIPDLTEMEVKSVESVINILNNKAYPNRHVGCTNMNEHSSRSHCLIFVKIRGENGVTHEISNGKLILIDLAGSERVGKSGVSGIGMKEAQSINSSLSALGNVINALQNKSPHIPYRSNPLTFILQDCLSGNNKCLMLSCISPALSSHGETLCSIQFAQRARATELGAAKKNSNQNNFTTELNKYKGMVKKMKEDGEKYNGIIAMNAKAKKDTEREMGEKNEQIEKLMGMLRAKEREINELKEKVGSSNNHISGIPSSSVSVSSITSRLAAPKRLIPPVPTASISSLSISTGNGNGTSSSSAMLIDTPSKRKRSRDIIRPAASSILKSNIPPPPQFSSLASSSTPSSRSSSPSPTNNNHVDQENHDPVPTSSSFTAPHPPSPLKKSKPSFSSSSSDTNPSSSLPTHRSSLLSLSGTPLSVANHWHAATLASTLSTDPGEKNCSPIVNIANNTNQLGSHTAISTTTTTTTAILSNVNVNSNGNLSVLDAAKKRIEDRKNKYKHNNSQITASLVASAISTTPSSVLSGNSQNTMMGMVNGGGNVNKVGVTTSVTTTSNMITSSPSPSSSLSSSSSVSLNGVPTPKMSWRK